MSLSWDVTKIKDQEGLWYKTGNKDSDGKEEEKLNPVVEAVIWHQLITCTGGAVTEKNHELVFQRIWIWESIVGAILRTDGKPRPITLADIRYCIGLTTNCLDKGKRKFKDKMMASLHDRADREMMKQNKDAETTVAVMEESGAS